MECNSSVLLFKAGKILTVAKDSGRTRINPKARSAAVQTWSEVRHRLANTDRPTATITQDSAITTTGACHNVPIIISENNANVANRAAANAATARMEPRPTNVVRLRHPACGAMTKLDTAMITAEIGKADQLKPSSQARPAHPLSHITSPIQRPQAAKAPATATKAASTSSDLRRRPNPERGVPCD